MMEIEVAIHFETFVQYFTLIWQGTAYLMCPTGVTPTASNPCEPGVTAQDDQDGPAIQSQVWIQPQVWIYQPPPTCSPLHHIIIDLLLFALK
jgi:hypothetical protein